MYRAEWLRTFDFWTDFKIEFFFFKHNAFTLQKKNNNNICTKKYKHVSYFYWNTRRNSSRKILDVAKQTKNGVEHDI